VSSILSAGIAATLTISGCNSYGPKHHDQRLMNVPHLAGTPLNIQNANGSVEAIQINRSDVAIVVDLYGRDLERLGFATVHADRQGDNTLRVWVEWPGGVRKNGEGSYIAMEIPDASGVEIHSSNGGVTIAGLSGHADLRSGNGSIRVDRHDGSVFADTSNGKVHAEHVSGEIEMYTSNGGVIVTDAFGPIRTETSNGNIFVSTMDGNEGPVRLWTSNGRVDLELGDGFEGVLKCQTSNGKISVVDLSGASLIQSTKNNVELQIGDSTEVSAVRTSNGSVRVRGTHTEP